jgi:hypothetical protein
MNADPALNRSHAITPVSIVCRDAQRTRHNVSGHKYHVYAAVESIAAQILRGRFCALSGTRPKETKEPVDLQPDASPTFARDEVNLVYAQGVQDVAVRF